MTLTLLDRMTVRSIHACGAVLCLGTLTASGAVVFGVRTQQEAADLARIAEQNRARAAEADARDRVESLTTRRDALESELAAMTPIRGASRPTESLAVLVVAAERAGLLVADTRVGEVTPVGATWRCPLGMTLSGTFDQVVDFLDVVWTDHPGIAVVGLQISVSDASGNRVLCRFECNALIERAGEG